MSKVPLDLQRDTAQAAGRQPGASPDERVYASLESLVRLQHQARGFTFLPRQPVHSLLAGRHASRMRGRGLNFEEIRAYHPGDDIRTIDWKVTARTRSPHTRVFTEERDRPVLLVVDQRIDMFFGSRVYMKSVVAARIAALSAWRVLDAGDRVGALVFDDSDIVETRPQRSRNTVMRILRTIVDANGRLSVVAATRGGIQMLNEALEKASRLAGHDYLVVVISDFHGADDTTLRHLQRISAHNDLLGCLVYDPSSSNLPRSREFVITDGELQIDIPNGTGKKRKKVEQALKERTSNVLQMARRVKMPMLPINTSEEVIDQIRTLIGQRGQKSAR